MADFTITIEGTEQIDLALKRLREAGSRKRDVTKVFSQSVRPLISAAKATAPMNKRARTSSREYESRRHTAGTLKRSIKFKTSKRYHNIWYVVPQRGRKANYDAWYAHMVGEGTKRGITPNPFMQRAWNTAGNHVVKNIETGLWNLLRRVWDGR